MTMIVNDELGWIWKEAAMTHIRILAQHLPEEPMKTTKNLSTPVKIAGLQAGI
jgi:hypothetical protein